MKLLLDANLSPYLVRLLSDLYLNSLHVRDCDLEDASDEAIWEYARKHDFAIVSKDSDFAERSILHGAPPKVIWIRIGNCSTTDLATLLRSASISIHNFIAGEIETCLILGQRQSTE